METKAQHKITFIEEKCTRCGLCESDCPQIAIHPDRFTIDLSCIHCDHCVALCPSGALAVNGTVPERLVPHQISPANFLNLIKAKRSLRRFTNKPVDESTIQLLTDAFRWIPTAKNARESFAQVITGDQLDILDREVGLTLIKSFHRIFNNYTRPFWYLFANKKAKKYFKTKERFIERQSLQSNMITHKAPLVLLFHAPKSAMSNGNMDNNIAAAYIALYAQTLQMGTCYNGYIVFALKRNKKLSSAMGIPSNHQVFSSLLIGYPKTTYLREVVR